MSRNHLIDLAQPRHTWPLAIGLAVMRYLAHANVPLRDVVDQGEDLFVKRVRAQFIDYKLTDAEYKAIFELVVKKANERDAKAANRRRARLERLKKPKPRSAYKVH